MSIKVNLKGDSKEFESGVSVAEIAKSIGAGLYKAACAGKVDGEVVDLRTPLTKDCNLEILTFSEEEGKKAYWQEQSLQELLCLRSLGKPGGRLRKIR